MSYQEMAEKAEAEGTARVITAEYMKFENPGDRVVGRMKSRNEVTSRLGGGTYYQYLFETDDGMRKFALGRATDAEAGGLLAPGRVYLIEFKGTDKLSGGRQVNRFDIKLIQEPGAEPGEDEDIPF